MGKILAALLLAFSVHVFANIDDYKKDINATLSTIPWGVGWTNHGWARAVKTQIQTNIATLGRLQSEGVDTTTNMEALREAANRLKALSANFNKPDSGYLKTEMSAMRDELAAMNTKVQGEIKLITDAKRRQSSDARLQNNSQAKAEAANLSLEISNVVSKLNTCVTVNNGAKDFAEKAKANVTDQINAANKRILELQRAAKAAQDKIAANEKGAKDKIDEDDKLLKETNDLIAEAATAMEKFKESKCEEYLARAAKKEGVTECEKGLKAVRETITRQAAKIEKLQAQVDTLSNPTEEMIKEQADCAAAFKSCVAEAKEAFRLQAQNLSVSLESAKRIRTNMMTLDQQISDASKASGDQSAVAVAARKAFEENKIDHINSIQRMRLRISLGIHEMEANNYVWMARGQSSEQEANSLKGKVQETMLSQQASLTSEAEAAAARAQACQGWVTEAKNAKSIEQLKVVASNLTEAHTTASATGTAPAGKIQ